MKTSKCDESEQRKVERAKRTAQQQLALLDERPGNSLRERARLLKEIKDGEKLQRSGKKQTRRGRKRKRKAQYNGRKSSGS